MMSDGSICQRQSNISHVAMLLIMNINCIIVLSKIRWFSMKMRDNLLMLVAYCWPIAYDAGPTSASFRSPASVCGLLC